MQFDAETEALATLRVQLRSPVEKIRRDAARSIVDHLRWMRSLRLKAQVSASAEPLDPFADLTDADCEAILRGVDDCSSPAA